MQRSNNSDIVKFLNKDKNSRLREAIFKYAFFHDIKLAAAQFQDDLKIYEPEVDNEGCDIIIEDTTDFSRKIQLKSIYYSKTSSWHIHKSILLPSFYQMNDFGIDTTLGPTYPGAVVLISAKEKQNESTNLLTSHESIFPQNDYEYLFTDINVIYLILFDVIKSNSSAKANAERVITLMRDQFHFDKIKLTKNLFIKVNGTASLIKLMGFCRQFNFLNYSHEFIRNTMNPSGFFKTLEGYNPYERSSSELQRINELLIKDKEVKKRLLLKCLEQFV